MASADYGDPLQYLKGFLTQLGPEDEAIDPALWEAFTASLQKTTTASPAPAISLDDFDHSQFNFQVNPAWPQDVKDAIIKSVEAYEQQRKKILTHLLRAAQERKAIFARHELEMPGLQPTDTEVELKKRFLQEMTMLQYSVLWRLKLFLEQCSCHMPDSASHDVALQE